MVCTIALKDDEIYDRIIVNNITKSNLYDAYAKANQMNEAVIVKVSKVALREYHQIYHEEQLLKTTPVGHSFTILGVRFVVIAQRPKADLIGNIELEVDQYYPTDTGPKKINRKITMFYNQSLLKFIYNNLTKGGCIYY